MLLAIVLESYSWFNQQWRRSWLKEVINGGFGLLHGSKQSDKNLKHALLGRNNGIARRSWARNGDIINTIKREMKNKTIKGNNSWNSK